MGSLRSSLSLFRSIHRSPGVSKDYLSSNTLTLLNPHSYPSDADTLYIQLPASTISNLTDEQILALFTKGFFGGPIFRIESWLLRAGLWKAIGNPHSSEHNRVPQAAQQIWNISSIPITKLLPLYSTIFGSFQLLATNIPQSTHHHPCYSFLDFSYGSSTSQSSFVGNHRFIVRRPGRPVSSSSSWVTVNFHHSQEANPSGDKEVEVLQESMADGRRGGNENEDGKGEVEIRLEMLCCDPTNPMGVGWLIRGMGWFHRLYGRLLFWDGVRRVVSGGEVEGQKRT